MSRAHVPRGAVLTAAALAALIALPALAASPKLEPSETCGACHETIFDTWKDSAHALSLSGDVFLKVFRQTERERGKAVGKLCLECHAPLVAMTGDHALEYALTWEGINCEVCHSLVSVEIKDGKSPKVQMKPGPVKRGPIHGADDSAHGVAFSELHTDAKICGWCHEYVNPEGTGVLTTYSEWKSSSAAKEGRTCQTCHMSLAERGAVDPRTERNPDAPINLHQMPGGHSLSQLHSALAIQYEPRWTDEGMMVAVRIINKGAGHAVPTGMPGRRVVLELQVDTNKGASFEETRTYGRLFSNAEGTTIVRDSDYFTAGITPIADSRIKADETREEIFEFPMETDATCFVSLRLVYEHFPTGSLKGGVRQTFFAERRTLLPKESETARAGTGTRRASR